MRRASHHHLGLLFVLPVLLAGSLACTDPVLDRQIDALGPEVGEVNAEHRPGQPCVLCHSEFGTSSSIFRLAGTVFESPTKIVGVEGVEVRVVDAYGTRFTKLTNRAGNFYISSAEGEVKFPVRVRISKNGEERPMLSHIGREPSCAGCHFDPPAAGPGKVHYKAFEAVGHIYLNRQ